MKKFALIALLSLSILGVFCALLLLTPKAVQLVESKITFLQSSNIPGSVSAQEILIENLPRLQIVSASIAPPVFSSNVVLAKDFETGKILFAKNETQRVPPASTTKIMTALVAADFFKPADILTVPEKALVGGSSMGLSVGEKLTFRSLLYGMLLNSGNDAAYTIALNFPGGLGAFINKMNEKVVSLGLVDTHFQNPAGFDNPNHYSSAVDLATIARLAVLNPQLARIVSTKQTEILSTDKSKAHVLKNLNKLLLEEGVLGIKTGTTENAGENLVGLIEKNNHKILTVVLGSNDRFNESKRLIDWTYQNYTWGYLP